MFLNEYVDYPIILGFGFAKSVVDALGGFGYVLDTFLALAIIGYIFGDKEINSKTSTLSVPQFSPDQSFDLKDLILIVFKGAKIATPSQIVKKLNDRGHDVTLNDVLCELRNIEKEGLVQELLRSKDGEPIFKYTKSVSSKADFTSRTIELD